MPGKTSRIEIDPATGTIAFHDARPALRRAFVFWWVVAGAGILLSLICLGSLGLLVFSAKGAATHHQGLGKALIGLSTGLGIGAALIVLGLYRQARVIHRHLDPNPDLVLSAAGLEDRWLGLGVIPWSEIEQAELHMQRPLNRLGIAIRCHNLDGWMDRLPVHQERSMLWRFWLAERFGNRFRLSQTGGETFGVSLYDILYALACHVPVEGLPYGYRPVDTALQGLTPPPANLHPLPEMALDQIDTTPLSLRLKPDRGKTALGLAVTTAIATWLVFMLIGIRLDSLVALPLIAALACMAWIGWHLLRRLLDPSRLVLHADTEGLTLMPYRYFGVIAWADIFAIDCDIDSDKEQHVLRIDLRDIAAYDRRLWPWTRLWYRCRRWFGHGLRLVVEKPEGSFQMAVERLRALRLYAIMTATKTTDGQVAV